VRILELLVRGDHSVQELQSALRLGQPLVSQQLAVLRARNIVTARKLGTSIRYTLRDPLIARVLQTAGAIFDNHLTRTQRVLQRLR
jgi:ArsR family transcriptional regulator